jgi:serine/threonine protein phosphatase 1
VFGLWQRPSPAPSKRAFQVPPGTRVYAVGDIHGCARELEDLLARIDEDRTSANGDVHLVFLGDLIDRGPDSAAVVRRLREGPLPGDRHSFLLGNHEEAMLSIWNGDLDSLSGWLTYGGMETLESYGLSRSEIFALGADLPRRMREVVPASDIAFMAGFEDQVRIGDYLFVHAGIRPGVPLNRQEQFDLRWIRDEFLADEETDHGVMVVHGHTITDAPDVRPNRIGIDTGCFESGLLTALVLEKDEMRFITNA